MLELGDVLWYVAQLSSELGFDLDTVAAANLATANAYLAPVVTGNSDSTSELQAVADAVNALLLAADGSDNNNANLTQAQFQILGATSIDSAVEVSLLNDVLDMQSATSVDTPAKLAALAQTVSGVFDLAAGLSPNPALSASALSAIGITGVTADNLAAVLAAIAASADDGSGVNTLAELQTLIANAISAYNSAVSTIGAFTGSNTAPTTSTYTAAGISGVDSSNLAAINGAIAALPSGATDAGLEIQTVVDAYTRVLDAADGNGTNTPDLSTADLTALQLISIASPTPTAEDNAESALLISVIGARPSSAVDTYGELQTLANSVTALINSSVTGTPAALSVQDLSALGLTGVNSSNLSAILNAIASASLGNIDSLTDLQAIVNNALAAQAAALSTLVGYANSNSGTAPAESVYTSAGVTGLQGNATLLAAVNTSLASTTITGPLVATPAEVQTLVDAYAAILAEANGNGLGRPTPHQTIGVTRDTYQAKADEEE
jgi:hypothetical protein